jgi:hypothetical protein
MTQAPVNSIKLTKLEKSVLEAISQPKPRGHSENYPEGSDEFGIASTIWGDQVLNRESRGGHFCGDVSLAHSARSSLSRTLKQLLFKGLVKKCKPVYQRGWVRGTLISSGEKYGLYDIVSKFLRAQWLGDSGWRYEKLNFERLPRGCHVWWQLTEKGKEVKQENVKVQRQGS